VCLDRILGSGRSPVGLGCSRIRTSPARTVDGGGAGAVAGGLRARAHRPRVVSPMPLERERPGTTSGP
jgi:hypothetical protein